MRRFFHEYTRLSALERIGISAMLLACLAAVAGWFFVSFNTADNFSSAEEAAYIAAGDRLLARNEAAVATLESLKSSQLFGFDPNTLDSAGFIQLGLRAKTVHLLLNWRRKGKHFYQPQDFKPLYTLTDAEYNRLEPYIVIGADSKATPTSAPAPTVLELNRVDSFMLLQLKGIGPALAHKILERKRLLGGFVQMRQLREIPRISEHLYDAISIHLRVDSTRIRRININTATSETLSVHPYIGAQLAAGILVYRDSINGYDSVSQIQNVPLMTKEKYQKMAAYLTTK